MNPRGILQSTLLIFSFLFLGVVGLVASVSYKATLPFSSFYTTEGVLVDKPFTISFNQEIKLHNPPLLTPSVSGSWHEERGFLGIRAISFIPDDVFSFDQSYEVSINSVHVFSGKDFPRSQIIFKTELAENIASFRIQENSDNPLRPTFELVPSSTSRVKIFQFV